jgi:tRNA (guanine9-N1)-methyltransferase
VYGDADATKSQDAVITEMSEQDVEEASTAEVRSTRSAIEDDANVQIAVGIIGDVPAVDLNLEQISSLSQRDGYESREASNGTGLYGYDEKVEAGPSAETMCRKEESNVAVSECGDQNGNSSDAPQVQEEDLKRGPALSGNVEGLKPPLPVEAKALSKNAQKALAKQERYKQAKQQRRAQEKEARHQETARKRREWQEKLVSLTEEEVKKAYEEKMGLRALRKEELKGRKEKLQQAMQQGQNIVIDLEFGEKMKPNEVSSLVQQVMYCYAANGKAGVPSRMSLTGCTGDIRKQLEKHSGFNNWLLYKEERSYLEVFEDRKKELVYLTADSETVLDSLDASKIYIVGGLVDRNREKGLTAQKAALQGIATAKLPIAEYMKMLSSQVLTVNQVVDILLHYMDRGDWSEALLRAIPPRKRNRTEQRIGGPAKQMRYESDQTTSSQNMDAMSEVGDDLMTSHNIESQSASFS